MPPAGRLEAQPFLQATVAVVPVEEIKILEEDTQNGGAEGAEETVSAEILALDLAADRRADLVEDRVENASVLETQCSLAEVSEAAVDPGLMARPPEQVVRPDLLVLLEQVILLLEMPEAGVARAEQEQVVPVVSAVPAVSEVAEVAVEELAPLMVVLEDRAGMGSSRSLLTSKENGHSIIISPHRNCWTTLQRRRR